MRWSSVWRRRCRRFYPAPYSDGTCDSKRTRLMRIGIVAAASAASA